MGSNRASVEATKHFVKLLIIEQNVRFQSTVSLDSLLKGNINSVHVFVIRTGSYLLQISLVDSHRGLLI